MLDTIFALSSGAPPAAIAVVRVSGPAAREALAALAGQVPEPRRAVAAELSDISGVPLDRALVLWLPGPGTATGEDVAELHLHGGRAVVAAVETALSALPGLRRAEPGEFTRRAFANGRIDLAEAEGLADLLAAETESQRRGALAMAGGALSRMIENWRERVLGLSAQVEAVLDFGDEDDVGDLPSDLERQVEALASDIRSWLSQPSAERLRDGIRVVLAGPPNCGKSSLFNALLDNEAAIVTPIAGTTRDVIERPAAIDGVPFILVDTAGLRGDAGDDVEAVGISRAHAQMLQADLVLWLGPEGRGPAGAWEIASKADLPGTSKSAPRAVVSAVSGDGIVGLRRALAEAGRSLLPAVGEVAFNRRQASLLEEAAAALDDPDAAKPLILAEKMRYARASFDRITGWSTTEDMLDALFGRFCIGK